jgi:hypothetical protein
MKTQLQLRVLLSVFAATLMFSSCGNIDIVKRKYRPGFHVDISKKREKTQVNESSAQKDSRKIEKLNTEEDRTAIVGETPAVDETLSAASTNIEVYASQAEKKEHLKTTFRTPEFQNLTFDRKMKVIEREVFKPTTAVRTEWMKWVSFGTGIGSLVFGALALLFSILTIAFVSSFVWGAIVLAMLLGAAAITFSILYKNQNGTDPKARLGFIFGIIGAGLAVLAIIFWAIFFTIFVL